MLLDEIPAQLRCARMIAINGEPGNRPGAKPRGG
jgi:hypothetical protein